MLLQCLSLLGGGGGGGCGGTKNKLLSGKPDKNEQIAYFPMSNLPILKFMIVLVQGFF